MRRVCLALLTLIAFSACARPVMRFNAGGFRQVPHGYVVYSQGPGVGELLGPRWRLDNYYLHRDVLTPKAGGTYEVTRAYDVNDDGLVDANQKEKFYDLLFEHREHDAAIWARTTPISAHESSKALQVFAERYVESVSGSGTVAVAFGVEGGQVSVTSVERRFASRVRQQGSCSVSGQEAYWVDFEVANVDQLQMSDQARWSRGRVVFVRTPYSKEVKPTRFGEGTSYPIMMLLGMSSAPAQFEALTQDFNKLLSQVAIADRKEAAPKNVGHTCSFTASPPTSTAAH